MKNTQSKLILKKSDYDLLVKYVYARMHPLSGDYGNAGQLYEELKHATIYDRKQAIPADIVQLNSVVEVEEEKTGRKMVFRIVLPAQANLHQQKLSLFAPLAIALMGYRKGQKVSWQMPSGEKIFLVRNVVNSELVDKQAS